MSRLLALYPARWRARYGDEFLALLEDRPPSLGDRLDIVRGALDARLRPQLPAPERVPDRAARAAFAGFGLFYVALALALSGPEHVDDYGTYRDGAAAIPFILAAMLLLAVAISSVVQRLPDRSPARAAAVIGVASGFLWSIAPWVMMLLAIFLVGVLVTGISAYRAGLWPAWLPALVALCAVAPVVIIVAQSVLPWYVLRQAASAYAGVGVYMSLSGIWLVFGIGLARGFPRAELGVETAHAASPASDS
jgi:hypothetical protein